MKRSGELVKSATRRQWLYAGETGPVRVAGKERRLRVFLVCRTRQMPETWALNSAVAQQLAQLAGVEFLRNLKKRNSDPTQPAA